MVLHTITGSISAAVSFAEGNSTCRQKAVQLGNALRLPVIQQAESDQYHILLHFTRQGLELQNRQTVPGRLHVDFLINSITYRQQHGGGIKEPLARAVGIKPNIRPSILDVTAGLGIDSYLLAGMGCSVRMIERSPFLAALLQDGLDRAAADNPVLLCGEAITLMAKRENIADSIYLDPMYPHRSKSALNKQEMRIIRELVGEDKDADKVFLAAMEHAKKRVVVKRPKGAPLLYQLPPSHVIKMKNSRFDVYMI